MNSWNARKTILSDEEMAPEHRLHRSLGWPHLVALGVGAIVGTGILTLIGVGAAKAGPSVILSFAIAGDGGEPLLAMTVCDDLLLLQHGDAKPANHRSM